MRTSLRTLLAALVLTAMLAPASTAGPASGGSPLSVSLHGPPAILAGTNASWIITVSYAAANGTTNGTGNGTSATRHVWLNASLLAPSGTVVLRPTQLDVPEGGSAFAQADVSIPLGALPADAQLVVYARTGDQSASASASFVVV